MSKDNRILNTFYKSTQIRGEDHSNSIIINKHIYKALLSSAGDQLLTDLFIQFELGPVNLTAPELGEWIEAVRKILNLNQTEFGLLVNASQSEISNLEKASPRASFSNDRLEAISFKTKELLRLQLKAA